MAQRQLLPDFDYRQVLGETSQHLELGERELHNRRVPGYVSGVDRVCPNLSLVRASGEGLRFRRHKTIKEQARWSSSMNARFTPSRPRPPYRPVMRKPLSVHAPSNPP